MIILEQHNKAGRLRVDTVEFVQVSEIDPEQRMIRDKRQWDRASMLIVSFISSLDNLCVPKSPA